MNEWIDELSDLAAGGQASVLVTVAGLRGSAPREVGAKMIVTESETIGTIGGGQLEYQSTRCAVDMLRASNMQLRSFPLGSSMGQCCGGVVEVLFEPVPPGLPGWLRDLRALHGQRVPAVLATYISQSSPRKLVVTEQDVYSAEGTDSMVARARSLLLDNSPPSRNVQEFYEPVVAPDLNIAVFGAGHVGSAVVAALAQLDCNIRWVDSRRNVFRATPANVRSIETPDAALEVAAMPPGSYYLIMTHSHALDFEICDRILRRRDSRYCGLIGSLSKRRRFEKRFRQQGMSRQMLDELVCPIGVDGIGGKKPAEIAVAVAAEILSLHGRRAVRSLPDNVRPLRR